MIDTEKVHTTIIKNIADNWIATEIDYPGIRFAEKGKTEWISIHISSEGGGGSRSNADMETGMISVNVYVIDGANMYRIQELVTLVKALISKANWVIEGAATGMIRVFEPDIAEVPVSHRDDLRQVSLQSEFQAFLI